ncbi:MAG: hypothetical protein OXI19_02905 [Gemmatimonadota bacterium]|nr:hypothetical protein [Gemmatimonadota bacterium]MYB60038.1 hypothetical protein [Gemmatimonadota bacterium]
MENVQLWVQPLILLTAFIFFWREAKGSRRELKEDIQKELNKIDARFNRIEDNIDARFDRFEDNMRKDMGEIDTRITRLEDRIREDMDKMDSRFDRLESALIEGKK